MVLSRSLSYRDGQTNIPFSSPDSFLVFKTKIDRVSKMDLFILRDPSELRQFATPY